MFVSLDNVIENPMWTMPYWNDEIAKFKYDELFGSGALLLGRVTYVGFAAAWPGRTDEQGYADRINSMPKYVVSTTLARNAESSVSNSTRLIFARVRSAPDRLAPDRSTPLMIAPDKLAPLRSLPG